MLIQEVTIETAVTGQVTRGGNNTKRGTNANL